MNQLSNTGCETIKAGSQKIEDTVNEIVRTAHDLNDLTQQIKIKLFGAEPQPEEICQSYQACIEDQLRDAYDTLEEAKINALQVLERL